MYECAIGEHNYLPKSILESAAYTDSLKRIISEEIVRYEEIDAIPSKNFDVLKWWEENKYIFPLLYKVSKKIFAIPASCAYSQIIFHKAKSLFNNEQIQLHQNLLHDILFINQNFEENEYVNMLHTTL